MSYFLFASYGNDSIALIQFAHEAGLKDVTVVYSDTGWAAPSWPARVQQGEALAARYGFTHKRTTSEGMINLVKRKKGWPMGGGKHGGKSGQFCTGELKIKPGLALMDILDPDKEATCLVGKRREESQERRDLPEWVTESEAHGGRELWHPLVRHTEAMRNELVERAGFQVLPHRSEECSPCVNANREDLRRVDESRIALIDITERELGFTKNDKPRVMFRPKRHNGAAGIREVIKWATRDKYLKGQDDLFDVGSGSGCDSGWCEQ